MNVELLNLFAQFMEKQEVLSKLTEAETLHGYNYSEIHTITAIGKLDKPNVTEIANYLRLTRGAISKITKRLIKEDLISTYMEPNNKQKIFFNLTDKGKELYDEHEVRHQLWLERDNAFLDNYDKKQTEFITSFMKEFNNYLEEKINEFGGINDAN